MGAMTSYAIQVAIVLTIEYLIYKLAIAGTALFRFNRLVILGCYVLALVAVPMVHISIGISDTSRAEGLMDIGNPTATIADVEDSAMLWQAIPIVYFAGMAIMLLWTLMSYFRLWRIIKHGEQIECSEYTLVVLEKEISPFSWGHYIILSDKDAENYMVLAHELAHIHKGHIYDLFLAQLFVIFNWFNPAAYLMRDELSAVQEYEADEQVLATAGVTAKDYQLLLIKKTAGAGFQAIANSLNHSQLKKRLTMMLKTKPKSARRLMAAVMLPAALVAASLTDIPAVAGVIQNVGAVSYSKVNENLSDIQMPTSAPAPAMAPEQAMPEDVCENPQQAPSYKKGEMEMFKVLIEKMHYPEDAAKANAQGNSVIGFIVNTNGTISDVHVVKSTGNASLDAEAVRVIKENLSSGWNPGIENGKAVACKVVLPINFRLN